MLEASTIVDVNYWDASKGLEFIQRYMDGFYLVVPDYLGLQTTCFPIVGWPLLIKTPIEDLTPEQLEKAGELGLYSRGEVATEAKRRLEQCQKDSEILQCVMQNKI